MNGYLVDTHVLLWHTAANPRLSAFHQEILKSPEPKFVSAASVWEIAIKGAIGKLRIPDELLRVVELAGMAVLPVTAEHALHVASLPQHHGDPFDRMLIAQAQVEGLTILTADRHIARYDIAVL